MVIGNIGMRVFNCGKSFSQETISEFQKYSSANVGDAMGRFRLLSADIRPILPKKRIVGRAVTVLTRGIDNLMIHKAMELARPGDILVVDSYGDTNASGWGGLMTRSASKIGLAGLIMDGSVRDLEDIRQLDFPVFARAVTARGCFKDGPGEINCNISCGGVSVSPGDLMIADEDGIACVPFDDVDYVLAEVQKLIKRENTRTAEIDAGVVFKSDINNIFTKKGMVFDAEFNR